MICRSLINTIILRSDVLLCHDRVILSSLLSSIINMHERRSGWVTIVEPTMPNFISNFILGVEPLDS